MDEKKDLMDQIITEDLLGEAEAIAREVKDSEIEVPDDIKNAMKMRLMAQIEEYEKERIYEQLSEEDKKALEVGRKMIEKEEAEASKGTVVYHRKVRKIYVALAAVLVLVLAMGVTCMGGGERIARMMQVVIGDREVVRVDTQEDNYIVMNEDEEETYQELKEVFGVEPAKMFHYVEGVKYKDCIIDAELQAATLEYEYKGESIHYFISSVYTKSSWGMDIEDRVTNQYYIEHEKCEILVKEYEIIETKKKYYSASYTYKGLQYNLIGMVNKSVFEKIVKNLIFF